MIITISKSKAGQESQWKQACCDDWRCLYKRSPHQEIPTASSIYHTPLTSLTYEDPYTLVLRSLSHLICDHFPILIKMVFSLAPTHSCSLITPKLYSYSVHPPVHFPSSSSIQTNLFLNSSPSTIWLGRVCHDCRPYWYLPALNFSTATWDLESQTNASFETTPSFMDTHWVHTLLGA